MDSKTAQPLPSSDFCIYNPEDDDEEHGPLVLNRNVEHGVSTRKILWSLLKQLSHGQDMTKITLPTFILEPRGVLERLADFYTNPSLLAKFVIFDYFSYFSIGTLDDPIERLFSATRFFISFWHNRPLGIVKPYNSLLGERFYCQFHHNDSTSEYMSEQVSHHPPISCAYIRNRRHNYIIHNFVHTKSKFWGNSAGSVPIGHSDIILLNRDNETYRILYPTLFVFGIFMGKLRIELGDVASLVCEKTGLKSELTFVTKPMFGGSYNAISGFIKPINAVDKNDYLYSISGNWDSKVFITAKNSTEKILFLDLEATPVCHKQVTRIKDQGKWESRRIWFDLTQAILKNDHIEATASKTSLEDAQRARASCRAEQKCEYSPTFFVKHEDGSFKYKSPDTTLFQEGEQPTRLIDAFESHPSLSPSPLSGYCCAAHSEETKTNL